MSSRPQRRSAAADPDVALMLEAAAGSEEAFARLVHRHQNPLLNFFVRMGAYRDTDAEDLVQETFLRIYRYRGKYRPKARFQTFLYLVARHVWADRCRKGLRRERMRKLLHSEADIWRRAPVKQKTAGRLDVQAALDTLSPKLRETLVLHVYQGLRYREIAGLLKVPLGTVKSRINLALEALRKFFDGA